MATIFIKVTRWRVHLNVGGLTDPFHNEPDGRMLSFDGYTPHVGSLQRRIEGDQLFCDVNVFRNQSEDALKQECAGFATYYQKKGNVDELLGVEVGIGSIIWDDLWARSFNPPPDSLASLSVTEQDAFPMATEKPIPVWSFSFSAFSQPR